MSTVHNTRGTPTSSNSSKIGQFVNKLFNFKKFKKTAQATADQQGPRSSQSSSQKISAAEMTGIKDRSPTDLNKRMPSVVKKSMAPEGRVKPKNRPKPKLKTLDKRTSDQTKATTRTSPPKASTTQPSRIKLQGQKANKAKDATNAALANPSPKSKKSNQTKKTKTSSTATPKKTKAQALQTTLMAKAQEHIDKNKTIFAILGKRNKKLKADPELQTLAKTVRRPITEKKITSALKKFNKLDDIKTKCEKADEQTLLRLLRFMTDPTVREVMHEAMRKDASSNSLHQKGIDLFSSVNTQLGFPVPQEYHDVLLASDIKDNKEAVAALKARSLKDAEPDEQGFHITLEASTPERQEAAQAILHKVLGLDA